MHVVVLKNLINAQTLLYASTHVFFVATDRYFKCKHLIQDLVLTRVEHGTDPIDIDLVQISNQYTGPAQRDHPMQLCQPSQIDCTGQQYFPAPNLLLTTGATCTVA